MAKTQIAQGTLKLELDDKKVKKNLQSLEQIKSMLEVDSNLEDISKKIEGLKDIQSEVDFQSNIDSILRDVDELEKISSEMDIETNVGEVRKQIQSLQYFTSEGKIEVDDAELQTLLKNLEDKKTIKAEVDVDDTEFQTLKKQMSEKLTISAVVTAAGAVAGEEVAQSFNEVSKSLQQKGFTEQQAQQLIANGLAMNLNMQELGEFAKYTNQGMVDLVTSSDENAQRTLAAFQAAEDAGAAGADDLARMLQALDDQGYTQDEQLYFLNAMVDQIQRGNTEIAEAIRERVPMLEAAGMDPAQFGSILEQSNLSSSEDISRIGDAIATLANNARLNNKDITEELSNIRDATIVSPELIAQDPMLQKYPEEMNVVGIDDLVTQTGLTEDQLLELNTVLKDVDLTKRFDESTDSLDELVTIQDEQNSYLKEIKDSVLTIAAERGLLKNAGDILAGAGGALTFAGDKIDTALTAAGSYALGKTGLKGLTEGLANLLPKAAPTTTGAAGEAVATRAGLGTAARTAGQLAGKAALPLAILTTGIELEFLIDEKQAELAGREPIEYAAGGIEQATIDVLNPEMEKTAGSIEDALSLQDSAYDIGQATIKEYLDGIGAGLSKYASTTSTGGGSAAGFAAREQAIAEGKITSITYNDNSTYEVSKKMDIVDATKAKKDTLSGLYSGDF
jgi:hypothetical protein